VVLLVVVSFISEAVHCDGACNGCSTCTLSVTVLASVATLSSDLRMVANSDAMSVEVYICRALQMLRRQQRNVQKCSVSQCDYYIALR
jgi:hypothetical protein